MPRRNRPRRPPSAAVIPDYTPRLSLEDLARRLVRRGLASPAILEGRSIRPHDRQED